MTVDPHLAAIQATYPDLARWQQRARRVPPEQPQRGSALHRDDAVFKWHPISETARLSLITAGEHLRLARDVIEAGQAYSTAHFTVLRGALVGAAQAVWVLAPAEPTERQQRGLCILAEMYSQLRKFDNEVNGFHLSPEDHHRLDGHLQWIRERESQVAALRTNTAQLNQTEFIKWSLEHLFQDEGRRQSGRALWRQMSADAHVLGWSLFQRASISPAERATGLSVGLVGGSWRDISEPFVAAHRLLKEGWSLFDRLCEGPS